MGVLDWFSARPPCMLRRVVLNIEDDDAAYEGVVWSYRRGWLVLRDVKVIQARTDPQRMDGEMIVHRDKITFLQAFT